MHVLVYTTDSRVMQVMLDSIKRQLTGSDVLTYIGSYNGFVSYIEDWGHSVDILFTEPDNINFTDAEMLDYISRCYPAVRLVYFNSGKPVIFANYCIPHSAVLPVPAEPSLIQRVLEDGRRYSHEVHRSGLYVSDRNVTTLIPFGRIFHIENQVRSSRLSTADGEISIGESLSSIEKRLDGRFLRCHQSFIVNVEFVRIYLCDPEDINYACLELFNGERIPVSVRRQRPVREAFERYCSSLQSENEKYIVKLKC